MSGSNKGNIKISTPYLLKYLADIEKYVNLPEDYDAKSWDIWVNNQYYTSDINAVASQMMKKVGLNGFNPICKWDNKKEHAAGYIELNDKLSGDVNIHLSPELQQDTEAATAVLAHEICHKLLKVRGLYLDNDQDMNEIYADLCTIYVGFGSFVLRGYKKVTDYGISTVTRRLGYLEYDVYERADRLVKSLKGNYVAPGTEGSIPSHISWALKEWVEEKDKRKLYLEGFKTKLKDFSRLNKYIHLLQQIIDKIKENEIVPAMQFIEKEYFTPDAFSRDENKTLKKPIKAFINSYPDLFSMMNDSTRDKARGITHCLSDCIDGISRHKTIPNHYFKVKGYFCPFCGSISNDVSFKKESVVVRCNKCHHTFAIDCKPHGKSVNDNGSGSTDKKWWQLFG